MFRIAVQTGGAQRVLGIEEAYRVIKEAGFDAVDANVDFLFDTNDVRAKNIPPAFKPGLTDRETLEYFKPWANGAKRFGLENYQAHAPFPSLNNEVRDDEYDAFLMDVLRRSILGCASIGCRNLVIHPFYMKYEAMMTKEEEWEINLERYGRLAKTAKEEGVTILLENMFVRNGTKIMAAICNDGEEAARYVDALNEAAGAECFGFCLDTGHALLVGKDIRRFMQILGSRIKAFHVHDNNGTDDQHLAPYMGIQDWPRFIEGLKEIRFDRTLSFETFMIWRRIDPALCPQMMRFIAETGRRFAWLAEG